MEPISSAFETLAEIAGALLGFAALAFALARGPEQLAAEDRLRLWTLLSMAVASILGGILPHVFVKTGVAGAELWRLWSAAYLIGAAQIFAVAVRVYQHMTPVERSSYWGHTPTIRTLVALQQGILFMVVVSQVLNAIGVVYEGEEWLCLTALLLTVVQAAVILLTIIFLRPHRPESEGEA